SDNKPLFSLLSAIPIILPAFSELAFRYDSQFQLHLQANVILPKILHLPIQSLEQSAFPYKISKRFPAIEQHSLIAGGLYSNSSTEHLHDLSQFPSPNHSQTNF